MLAVPTTAVLLVGTAIDYVSSVTPVHDAYDQAMADAALAIAAHARADEDGSVSVVIPPEALTVLRTDSMDAIYFRVTGPDGTFLAGDEDLPTVSVRRTNPSFRTDEFRGKPTRLVTYRSATAAGEVTTTVGETMNKRDVVRRQLLFTVLTADLLELGLILVLVGLGVSLALKPLSELRAQIARRSPRELEPLAPNSAPTEVRTLVDELNRLFSTIAQSSRAQRQFLENAAHQLRTPLAGIQAQLELLLAEGHPQAMRERLSLTLGATRRLSHTTQQLLALARSEHSSATYADFRTVELAGIAERCVTDCITRSAAMGVDLGADLQPASVEGVAWLLAEAVTNLVDNAITYTPHGGSITVSCGKRGEAPFIAVADTGVGIPLEERERVTQRFVRGQWSSGTGSGLGLAIVADVASLHGATLSIAGGADGRGTIVRIDFPARRHT